MRCWRAYGGSLIAGHLWMIRANTGKAPEILHTVGYHSCTYLTSVAVEKSQ